MSLLAEQVDALLTGETNPVIALANASAVINAALDDTNWVGFYLYNQHTETLDLGPFQGLVACMHIQPGRGVVGTAYANNEAMIVPDVHQFAGHIACDAASNSELVVPIVQNDKVLGILDIDSTSFNRFTETDKQEMEAVVKVLALHLDAESLAAVY